MSPTLPSVFIHTVELHLVRQIGNYGNNQPTPLTRVFFSTGDILMIASESLRAIGGNVTPNTTATIANPANVTRVTSEIRANVTPVTRAVLPNSLPKDPNGRRVTPSHFEKTQTVAKTTTNVQTVSGY